MTLKTLLVAASLVPLIMIAFDLQIARKYYRTIEDISGKEAIIRWLTERRLMIAGLVLVYLAISGVLLYTNLSV